MRRFSEELLVDEELRRAMEDFIALDEAVAGAPTPMDVAMMSVFGPAGGAASNVARGLGGRALRAGWRGLPVRGGTPEQQFVWRNTWNAYPAQPFRPTGMTEEAFRAWLRQGRLPTSPYDAFPVLRQRIGPGSSFMGGSPAWRQFAQQMQQRMGSAVDRWNARAFGSQARSAGSPAPAQRPAVGPGGPLRPPGPSGPTRPGNTRPPRLGPPQGGF